MLFEVAVVLKPTKKEEEEGKGEELILPPTPVIANNDKTAAMIAGQKAELKNRDPNRIEVLVRPFAVKQ